MPEIIKLGSLYLGSRAVLPGTERNVAGPIFVGDTVPGMELQWVRAGSLLVGDRCACTNVSWKNLNLNGLIFGRPIKIDGATYLCRSLKVGAKRDELNEWDSLLDRFGEDNDLWHWLNRSFWGQESKVPGSESHIMRGYDFARKWSHNHETFCHAEVGFRPVLEPIFSEPTNVLVDNIIKVFCPQNCVVKGLLIAFDEYDMVLISDYDLPVGCDWAVRDGNEIVLRRSAVAGIDRP